MNLLCTDALSGAASAASQRFSSLGSSLAARAVSATALFALCAVVALSPASVMAQAAQSGAQDRPETVITSDELDMVGAEDNNRFFFRRNVRIEATNMIATCDQMEIVAARGGHTFADSLAQRGAAEASRLSGETVDAKAKADSASKAAAAAEAKEDDLASSFGSIREIIMTGNVVISQEGRRATAGKAILYPQEGRVVLSGNPKVTDDQGTLSGYQMELLRGEKTVRVISAPDGGRRTSVTLPSIGNLGFDPKAATESTDSAPAPATPAAEAPSSAAPATSTSAPATPSAGNASAAASASSAASAAAQSAPAAGAQAKDAAKDAAKETAPAAAESNSRGWRPVTGGRR